MIGQRIALILLTIVLFGWGGLPVAQSRNLTDEWVEKIAAPLVENQIAEGLSIGYIDRDHWGIVHLGNAGEGKKATNLTLYEIGSISKVFTSLLLADAIERGEIELNSVMDVANPAGIRFPTTGDRAIKWIDLSTHLSGLPRLPANLVLSDPTDPYQDYDSKKAAAFVKQYEFSRKPGEAWEYSNFGVSVLGYLLEQEVGKSYQQLLRERIAKPLKMADCTVSLSGDQKVRAAKPYGQAGTPSAHWTFADMPGAGGIRATMRDMMRFAKAQLSPPKGTLGKAIELAWKQHTEVGNGGPAMGLGWLVHPDGQTRWHNGGTGGFKSAMFVNREIKCAVIVLCNTAQVDQVDQLATQLVMKAAGHHVEPKLAGVDKNKRQPPKLSPFTQVRFDNEKVIVVYDDQSCEWLELDGIKVEEIVASSKKQFGRRWQKRIREDLVELLWGMDHRPGSTVKLRLVNLKTKKELVVEKAPMTKENRRLASKNQPEDTVAGADHDTEKLAIDDKLRDRLVGRYQITPDFILAVSNQQGELRVGATNQPTIKLRSKTPTRWACVGVQATLEFELEKTGTASALVLHQAGVKQEARRIKGDLAIDAKLRKRLVGRYELNPNFIFDVKDQDGHLMVGITNQPVNEVYPDSPNRWSYRGIDATLEFELKKAGSAKSLVLHQNGASQKARRIN